MKVFIALGVAIIGTACALSLVQHPRVKAESLSLGAVQDLQAPPNDRQTALPDTLAQQSLVPEPPPGQVDLVSESHFSESSSGRIDSLSPSATFLGKAVEEKDPMWVDESVQPPSTSGPSIPLDEVLAVRNEPGGALAASSDVPSPATPSKRALLLTEIVKGHNATSAWDLLTLFQMVRDPEAKADILSAANLIDRDRKQRMAWLLATSMGKPDDARLESAEFFVGSESDMFRSVLNRSDDPLNPLLHALVDQPELEGQVGKPSHSRVSPSPGSLPSKP